MKYSFVFKMIFISFFIFILIYAVSLVGVQNDLISSNNFVVKNTVKESINIGDLRVNNQVSFDQEHLINSLLVNYAKANNIKLNKVKFKIAINENIVTVKIYTYKNMFQIDSDSVEEFSYQVVKGE